MTVRIALLLGDPAGIGPELAAKLVAQEGSSTQAAILLIGDAEVYSKGAEVAGVEPITRIVEDFSAAEMEPGNPLLLDFRPCGNTPYAIGEANSVNGAYVLETLKKALQLAREGKVDCICFAPLNKQAMHMGGSPFKDELHFFAHELNYTGFLCELNTFDRLWTTRVTSHIPLGEVSGQISQERVLQSVDMADRTLRAAGYERPRIAVAALNPHAGDGGLFGREEIDIIAPAVEKARKSGLAVEGPFPSDTVFIKARNGEFDVVVTMYHDQGQIAMKLMGFEKGVTVQGGLPIPITTPAHGTAFDITGKGSANVEATRQAFYLACKMGAQQRRKTSS